MNNTDEFVNIMVNNREKLVDHISKEYSYNYLKSIFENIHAKKYTESFFSPADKYLYRLMTGNFNNSRYTMSSIDWLPSEELINGILLIAKQLKINYIDEIYAGHGILSSLLSLKTKSEDNITITAADSVECKNLCKKLNFMPIANRSPRDYQYYPQLNEKIPQMVISTFYPSDNYSIEQHKVFIDEIMETIISNHHQLIIIILPHSYNDLDEPLHNLVYDEKYSIFTQYIKAVDKYYEIHEFTKKYVPSNMIAHFIINKNLVTENNIQIANLLENVTIPANVNYFCKHIHFMKRIYDRYNSKLVKNIYNSYDHLKPFKFNSQFIRIYEISIQTEISNSIYIDWIYTIDEFLFWNKCIKMNLYFIFDHRIDFYSFYTQSIGIDNSEFRRNFNFPFWIKDIKKMYAYIYLNVIKKPEDWRSNRNSFNTIFDKINKQNCITLFGK